MKYLTADKDRHGNIRRYIRLRGHPKVRIMAEPDSQAFAVECREGLAAARAAPKGLQHPAPHFVYVVAAAKVAIKIGVTCKVSERLAELQNGNHNRLRVVRLYAVASRAAALAIESRAHLALVDRRLSGEWFRAGHQGAAEAIERAAAELVIAARAVKTGWQNKKRVLSVPLTRLQKRSGTLAENSMNKIKGL